MSNVYDVVIIGGGATGLSACVYTLRYGLSTLLVEGTVFGGQIINADTIENFPGFPQGIKGPDLVAALQEQASDLGLEYGFGQVQSLDVHAQPMSIHTEGDEFLARAVIIATGGERNRLGVPGEDEFEGRGVSTCATCDGYFFADSEVTVIGGGDTALDEALYLAEICSKVTLVHRGDRLTGSKILRDRALRNPKLDVRYGTAVESIYGEEVVQGVVLRDLAADQSTEVPTAGVFVCVGYHPNTGPFRGTIPMDDGGHIKVDLKMVHGNPGGCSPQEIAAGTRRASWPAAQATESRQPSPHTSTCAVRDERHSSLDTHSPSAIIKPVRRG